MLRTTNTETIGARIISPFRAETGVTNIVNNPFAALQQMIQRRARHVDCHGGKAKFQNTIKMCRTSRFATHFIRLIVD